MPKKNKERFTWSVETEQPDASPASDGSGLVAVSESIDGSYGEIEADDDGSATNSRGESQEFLLKNVPPSTGYGRQMGSDSQWPSKSLGGARYKIEGFFTGAKDYFSNNKKALVYIAIGAFALIAAHSVWLYSRIDDLEETAAAYKLELRRYKKLAGKSGAQYLAEKRAINRQATVVKSLSKLVDQRKNERTKLTAYEKELATSLSKLKGSKNQKNRKLWREFDTNKKKRDWAKLKVVRLEKRIDGEIAKLDKDIARIKAKKGKQTASSKRVALKKNTPKKRR